jgi:hypothetical protein
MQVHERRRDSAGVLRRDRGQRPDHATGAAMRHGLFKGVSTWFQGQSFGGPAECGRA